MCINCLQSERNTLIVSVFKRERSLSPNDRKQLRTAYRQGGEGLDEMRMHEELSSGTMLPCTNLGEAVCVYNSRDVAIDSSLELVSHTA